MMTMYEYRRLSELGDRIKANLASKEEKNEYMMLLHRSGSISQSKYNEYLNQQGTKQGDDLVGVA